MKMFTRFAWGLRSFLRHTLSLEEAKATVQRRMQERESNFLRLLKRGVFGNPRSPYRALLRLANCDMADIQSMIRDRGLEGTLRALREAGVYIAFEEFKGRTPVVRHGQVIPVQTQDFDNPYLSHYYRAESGGTTGAGTRVMTDLEHLAAQAPHRMLADYVHGLLDVPTAIWSGILPDAGLNIMLGRARFGQIPQKWFSPVTTRDLAPSLKYTLATNYVITVGRLCGVAIPRPEPVRLDQASIVARWAAEMVKSHGACVVRGYPSKALRVCIAARDAGLDLRGASFTGGGEPPTPAKVREISRAGARWVPSYFFSEIGAVGLACARPADGNDLHFVRDALGLIQYPRRVPGSDMTVDAFLFTTLLPTAPKLMLNVETDDYGVIESRSCGCPMERYGFREHLRHIRSFQKLTGEGVTLVGSDMVRILEEVLPARFGGSPLDYQLLEEEDAQGFTRLSLLVSPKVELADERSVIDVVLQALGRGGPSADLARAIWSQAQTLTIKRAEPVSTARGKMMPLHLIKRSERPVDAPAGTAADHEA
jgi:hypothetical protein